MCPLLGKRFWRVGVAQWTRALSPEDREWRERIVAHGLIACQNPPQTQGLGKEKRRKSPVFPQISLT
jgi:hypothetical protein